MLHSSEPKNSRKVTWEDKSPDVQRLWSNYNEINRFKRTSSTHIVTIREEKRESWRNIKELHDLVLASFTGNNTSAKIENLENRIESFNKNR
jgi:hypothetical protein